MSVDEAAQAELEALSGELTAEDELGVVIRAHLRIEQILQESVRRQAFASKHLDRLGLDFDRWVTLALALGMNEELGPSLRTLGKLRNDFAHKPGTRLTEASVRNLYKTLSETNKQSVQRSFARIQPENASVRPVHAFGKLPARDQFSLIAVQLWAQLRASLVLLQRDGGVGRSESE